MLHICDFYLLLFFLQEGGLRGTDQGTLVDGADNPFASAAESLGADSHSLSRTHSLDTVSLDTDSHSLPNSLSTTLSHAVSHTSPVGDDVDAPASLLMSESWDAQQWLVLGAGAAGVGGGTVGTGGGGLMSALPYGDLVMTPGAIDSKSLEFPSPSPSSPGENCRKRRFEIEYSSAVA